MKCATAAAGVTMNGASSSANALRNYYSAHERKGWPPPLPTRSANSNRAAVLVAQQLLDVLAVRRM
jgi:hypothetical protein